MAKKYIKGFDGLRSYSILLVIITHLGFAHSFAEGSYLRDRVFYFFSGVAGVNIFFALSGFLITTLILAEYDKTGRFNVLNFFIRRFLRLLPPILPFYLALAIFMSLGYVRETYWGLLASVFYLYNYVPKAKILYSTELSHTWSLAVEEQFYLMWAFLFAKVSKKALEKTLWVLLLGCVLASYILPGLPINIKGEDYLLGDVFFVMRWTLPAIGPILIGSLLALWQHRNFGNIRERFASSRWGWIAFLVFLCPFYIPDFLVPIMRMLHATGASLLLVWILNNQSHKVVGALEWSPLRYIGTISYGLYIWQGFFVRTGPDFTPKIWVHDPPVNVLLTFVVAIVSYELYEKKVLALKKKFY